MLSDGMLYVLLGVFSLAVGSLLNVIIYRLPLMLKVEWETQCRVLLDLPEKKPEKVNLFFPRSFCPSCRHLIEFWNNIPLISYLLLRGQCRHCQARIPYRYPLVELLCFTLSMLAGWHFGFNLTLVYALLFIWIVICLTFIDLQHQLLPDSLCLGLLWIGLIANTQFLFVPLWDAVLSAAGAWGGLWLFVTLFSVITGKTGMGNGDLKLFAAFDAWLGWIQLPLILLMSSIMGALVGIFYLLATRQSKDTPIPFGPFLCIAGLVSLFWGEKIIHWYLQVRP